MIYLWDTTAVIREDCKNSREYFVVIPLFHPYVYMWHRKFFFFACTVLFD